MKDGVEEMCRDDFLMISRNVKSVLCEKISQMRSIRRGLSSSPRILSAPIKF